MSDPTPTTTFDEWAILELLGHVRLAGRVSEAELFGAKLGRIDIPGPDGSFTTQYFGAGSIYRLTPTTEAIARAVAQRHQPEPVHRWELPGWSVPPISSPQPIASPPGYDVRVPDDAGDDDDDEYSPDDDVNVVDDEDEDGDSEEDDGYPAQYGSG